MNYGELKTQFQDILNRSDVTNSQMNTCFQLAQIRLERILRLRASETDLTISTVAAVSSYTVPSNYLEMISITVDGLGELQALEPGQYRSAAAQTSPVVYTRIKDTWYFNSSIPIDAVAKILYFSKATSITTSDATTNDLSDNHPDILVYGALAYSADVFVDERRGMWLESFNGLLSEVLDYQITQAMHEGDNSIAPIVYMDDGPS